MLSEQFLTVLQSDSRQHITEIAAYRFFEIAAEIGGIHSHFFCCLGERNIIGGICLHPRQDVFQCAAGGGLRETLQQ